MSKNGKHIGKPLFTVLRGAPCPICKIRDRKASLYKRAFRKTKQVHVHATCGRKECKKQHWWLRWRETRLQTLRYEREEREEQERRAS